MAIQPNRLFFALLPDDATRDLIGRAAKEVARMMPSPGRPIVPEKYHLTLSFLGSAVSPEHEAASLFAAREVRVSPFELRFDLANSFSAKSTVWWVAPGEQPQGLSDLWENLHSALRRNKIPLDRKKFVPHVSIFRDAPSRLPQTRIAPFAWSVSDFALMRSEFNASGSRYTVLKRWPLAIDSKPEREQLALW